MVTLTLTRKLSGNQTTWCFSSLVFRLALTGDFFQSLFKFILTNELHVLYPLLPDKTNFSYNLCTRRHNRQFIRKTTPVNNSDFFLECYTSTRTNC